MSKVERLKVGILGATGTVGQKFIILLQNHPWFEIAALGASKDSAGKRYGDLMESRWKQNVDIPPTIAKMKILPCDPKYFRKAGCSLVFSGLDADVAKEIEKSFAVAGFAVVSNAKNWRMEPDVPLLVPEVNPEHIKIIPEQQKKRKWRGFIVTNPNCVAIPLVMALKPIHQKFGVSKVMVTSMQAISGAGYPGVPSLDILDNVIPMIGGEEPKVETEPLKLLGELKKFGFKMASIKISAQCNRVPTRDGHFLTVAFTTRKPTTVARLKQIIKSFKSEPQKLKLPSAPEQPLVYLENDFRPQVRLDRNRGNGMTVSVGRLREDSVLGQQGQSFKMVVLGHNTIRGAAGAAILNAELLLKKGHLRPRPLTK